MMTKTRLVPLLAMTGLIDISLILHDGVDEPSICIGIPADVFDSASDTEIAAIANLFRGMSDDCFNPRLLAIMG